MPHIIVLGGGFGGSELVRELERQFRNDSSVAITLVSRNNYLTFTPLLPEVSGNSIEERHAVPPLRGFLKRARFHQGEVRGIDVVGKQVTVEHADGKTVDIAFDYLAIALGSVTNYRKTPGATENSFDLKSLSDAIRLRNHVLSSIELADVTTDPDVRRALLTFVGVGGGYAGVEGLGQLIDFIEKARRFYPTIKPEDVKFVLATHGKRLLDSIDDTLGEYVIKKLRERGVDIRLGVTCSSVSNDTAELTPGGPLPTCTVLWAGGIAVNPLIVHVDLPKDQRGSLIVDSTLRVKDHPNIFALGDCAAVPKADGFYPPTAQNALREGKVAARNIAASIKGRSLRPFIYHPIGSLATIGHYQAVAQLRGIPFSGFFAWLVWRAVYLTKLGDITRQVRVVFDWIIDFILPSDVVQLPVEVNDDIMLADTDEVKVETPRPLPGTTEAEAPATPLQRTG